MFAQTPFCYLPLCPIYSTQQQLPSSRRPTPAADSPGVQDMEEATATIVVCLLITAAIVWVWFRYRKYVEP